MEQFPPCLVAVFTPSLFLPLFLSTKPTNEGFGLVPSHPHHYKIER
jgi:hypothetical protein